MPRNQSLMVRRAGRVAAFTGVLFYAVVAANAQAVEPTTDGAIGRIEFGDSALPPATVEIDLNQGMFHDLFGIGDAAVAGVAEALLQSAGANSGAEGTRLAADQLAAARQVLQLARDVVREVRVRIYQRLPEELGEPASFAAHYDDQLNAGNWDTVVRVRDGKATVRVSLLRNEDAVRAAFVVVADGRDLVLVNVVGDVSPENVKKLTSAAAKIGLENGLGPMIEAKMKHVRHGAPPAAPRPPGHPDSSGDR